MEGNRFAARSPTLRWVKPEAAAVTHSSVDYPKDRTAYLLVDPYNDFLSEGGKVWPRIKLIATQNGLLDNLRTLDHAVRAHGIPVFFVPHRRWEPGDYDSWDHPNPNQRLVMHGHHFARGEWGGEWHPDFT